MKGAQAGMSFGPMGAAIGGVVGAGAGLLGGAKAKEDAADARHEFASTQHNDATNSYKYGGKMLANLFEDGGDEDPNDFGIGSILQGGPNHTKGMYGNKNNYGTESIEDQTPSLLRPNESYSGGPNPEYGTVQSLIGKTQDSKGLNPDDLDVDEIEEDVDIPNNNSNFFSKENLNKAGNFIGAGMRYAPALMNASQLIGLKKPNEVSLGRLNNKYNEQLVDERGLQNAVQGSVLNNRDAILSSSGGSGSAARANLLASQLQGSKALSNAYQQAGSENRQEKRTAQNFDMNVDRSNLQQSNQEKSLNLGQNAAYQTNRSRLLAQLGNDLGGIGSEELYKKFPELMGLSYDSKGRKIKKKTKK